VFLVWYQLFFLLKSRGFIWLYSIMDNSVYISNNNPASIIGIIILLYYLLNIYNIYIILSLYLPASGRPSRCVAAAIVAMRVVGIGGHTYFIEYAKSVLKVLELVLVITYKLSNQLVCEFLCSHLHNISDRLISYTT